jgi:hypothetical protein
MTATSVSLLRRFVIAGLRDTLDCYTAGTLPLHRFAWELDSRLTALAELTGLPDWRALAALSTAQRAVAAVDTTLRAAGRADLTTAEGDAVRAAVSTLRATLARFDTPESPPASESTPTSSTTALPAPVELPRPRPVVVPLPARPCPPRPRPSANTSGQARSGRTADEPWWPLTRPPA